DPAPARRGRDHRAAGGRGAPRPAGRRLARSRGAAARLGRPCLTAAASRDRKRPILRGSPVAPALHSASWAQESAREKEDAMKAVVPWTGMTALKTEMDRLFDHFWEKDYPEWPAVGEWTPKLDVADTKDALVVKAEIPGIDPKEIALTLHDQVLTIK